MYTPKKDDKNSDGTKFKMFLQKYIKKEWICYLYHVSIYFRWWCLLLMILIIFIRNLMCMGWIQGLNT